VVQLNLRIPVPSPRQKDDRGAVAILVAAMLLVIMGLAAIVVDLGFARDRKRVAQNAADAAALAVATCFAAPTGCPQDPALLARGYVRANGWPDLGTSVGVDLAARTVTITLPAEESPSFFAGAVGVGTASVGGSARASWGQANPGTCALCVFGDLNDQANGDVFVPNGGIVVGGNLDVGPNGEIRAAPTSAVGVVGTISARPNAVTPRTYVATSVPDPFATVPAPLLGQPVRPDPSGPCQPGTYDDVSGCTSMSTGVYVITGSSSFGGNRTLDATSGVLLYATCSSGNGASRVSAACTGTNGPGGSITTSGSHTMNVTALPSPVSRTLAIYYDPRNTSDLILNGGQQATINGSVYAKAAPVTGNGNGGMTVSGAMVVGSLRLNGNPRDFTISGPDVPGGSPVPGRVHLAK
jgi:hypothetical protein